MVDRVPHEAAADRHGVERVFLADHELLDEGRPVRARRGHCDGGAQFLGRLDPEGAAGAGAGRGLHDEREPLLGGERRRLGLVADERVPGAGQAVRAQHVLHPRLVAEIVCRRGAHPRESECVAQFAERHLEILERAQQPVDPPEFRGELSEPGVDPLRRQRVLDPRRSSDAPP